MLLLIVQEMFAEKYGYVISPNILLPILPSMTRKNSYLSVSVDEGRADRHSFVEEYVKKKAAPFNEVAFFTL